MTKYVSSNDLQIAENLYNLMNDEILPRLGIEPNKVWQGFSNLVNALSGQSKELLLERDKIQAQLDAWHKLHPGKIVDMARYKKFLADINYLVPEGPQFQVTTDNVDHEIANIAAPQLVVPINNARFALNAANARWGSLYDALYGSNVLGTPDATLKFDSNHASKVIKYASDFLDKTIPLQAYKSHHDVTNYYISTDLPRTIDALMDDGDIVKLEKPELLVGYNNTNGALSNLIFKHNGLNIEVAIDKNDKIGALSKSGVKDIKLESAISTILDCEDSVAAVDAEDKEVVYRNFLGLMRGDLTSSFEKNGQVMTRTLNQDKQYLTINDKEATLPARSLLLIRNVGHLMTTDAVLTADGKQVPEGMLDALFTVACALYDLNNKTVLHNSNKHSIYIVKPKMHGPREVALANSIFNMVEDIFALPRNTIKIGVMDEEKRTTVNLKECIRAVKERLFFINTGFLDRTGDEIHTVMAAGAVLPKDDIKNEPWLSAYEQWSVDIGLECALPHHAQIGKGMWAKPDDLKSMLTTKGQHLIAGANCSWVPSPTAAVLHAMHYHQVNVFLRQREIANSRMRASLDDILTPPLLGEKKLSPAEIQKELNNNCQSLLGYVVRWVDQGIGCSKVLDYNDVALMEDRATLRISSQHIANWLKHGICTVHQVEETLKTMAVKVDAQNANDPNYQPMAPNFDGVAFQAAHDLVFKGLVQPNGYTEPLLHSYRYQLKQKSEEARVVMIEPTVRMTI